MHVMIVDDQASQRTLLRSIVKDISETIKVSDVADPVQALLLSQKDPPDMLILDFRMPKMDGLEFVRRFRRPLSQRDIPVIFISVVSDANVREAALSAGVIDYIVKPIQPMDFKAKLKSLIEMRQHQVSQKNRSYLLEHQLNTALRDIEYRERELFLRMAKLIEMRETNPQASSEVLSSYAVLLAEAIGLAEDEVRNIANAILLHDIGNVAIPDAILNKPEPLDKHERSVMQSHTVHGHGVLHESRTQLFQMAADIALSHHEHWDGSGYPQGLQGVEIPISARVAAAADMLNALTCQRAYRPAYSFDESIEIMQAASGTKLDPTIVNLLMTRKADMLAIYNAVQDLKPKAH
ncbi:MAG: HD domain-containing phosphohydrolase [Arenimonas sp.]